MGSSSRSPRIRSAASSSACRSTRTTSRSLRSDLKIEATIVHDGAGHTMPPAPGTGSPRRRPTTASASQRSRGGPGGTTDPLCLGSLPDRDTREHLRGDLRAVPGRADPGPLLRRRQHRDRRHRQHRSDAGAVQREPGRPGRVGQLRGRCPDADLQRVRAALLDAAPRVECYRATTLSDIDTRPDRRATVLDLRGRRAGHAHGADAYPRRAGRGRQRSATASLGVAVRKLPRVGRAVRCSRPTPSTCITAASAIAGDAVYRTSFPPAGRERGAV